MTTARNKKTGEFFGDYFGSVADARAAIIAAGENPDDYIIVDYCGM